MPNPTNHNEAEDAERRMLENELLGVVSQLPFLERGKTLSSSMYPELTDFILADRQDQKQKWTKEIEARFKSPGKYTNAQVFNSQEYYGYNRAADEYVAAWRAALRGEKQ